MGGELSARGHEVFLYAYEPTDAPGDPELPVTQFPGRSRRDRLFGLPRWLRRRAAEDRLDAVVSMLTFSNLAVVAGLRTLRPARTRVVISERSVASLYMPTERGAFAKRLLARLLYPRADAMVAISHPVAADAIGAFRLAPGQVHVVPNPVLALPAEAVPASLPRSLHLLFVGRIVDVKQPRLVLATLGELRAAGVDARATFVGSGPLTEALSDEAAAAGLDVRFAGWQQPWWEGVTDADCLLLPSSVEGFANVLVEAAAAGIPVVARSDALGVADAVVPGVTGELARNGSPRELAAAVLRATAAPTADPRTAWLRRFSVGASTDCLLQTVADVVRDAA